MKARAVVPTLLILFALILAGCGGSSKDKTAATPTLAVPSGSAAVAGGSATASQSVAQAAPSGASGAGTAVGSLDQTLPALVSKVRPSVVTVLVDDGEGSGIVWDNAGDIVTNNHVIENTQNINVVLVSGTRMPAKLVATDPVTDVAVIKVDKQDLPPATFSKSLPPIGTPVLAIGNPLGFESSVTFGIISGQHRSIPSGGQTPALVDLLQTDAAISPGNSGGALIDGQGEVVGMNVAYIPPDQSAVSIGFAIPAGTVMDTAQQLLTNGKVQHAFLGIEPRPLDQYTAQQLGLDVSQGVLVFSLSQGG
ncbi:MAG TPA: trypsin-like peptidase domain-containing protein, partial [Dehalococcoidia bacterium]|nr:trypsin-like peptidase domain-containing protein [Dehalococcoidia bacterium]